MTYPRDHDERDPLGWHVIPGTLLLDALRRCQLGEEAGLVFAELWANAEHETCEDDS